MTNRPTARTVTQAHPGDETVTLSYDARFLRRRVLTTAAGEDFLVDLAQTTSLDAGDAFHLDDGRRVAVVAAEEALYEVRGDAGALVRLAWHIGNRHTPCQIAPDRLLIQRDHVMADMLARLGAEVREVTAPFTPEGGAYGHGRTHGHDHGAGHGAGHGASHDHGHGHGHAHAHGHDNDNHTHPHGDHAH